jgi:hypothetical protein
MRVGDELERDIAPAYAARAARGDRQPRLTPRSERHARGLVNGPLKDESARIVRDASHHVEPPGRASDEHGLVLAGLCPVRPGAGIQSRHDIGGEPLEVRHLNGYTRPKLIAHAINPRRTNARRSCGSINALIDVFA